MEARYTKQLSGKRIRCVLCPRNCSIAEGKVGSCQVRKNVDGVLIAENYGIPIAMSVDPIEKKPLYHFYPGEKIFSFGTEGCNLFCKWCQNSEISHPEKFLKRKPYGFLEAKYIVELCKKSGCRMIAFTYTEPTIFYEYMSDIAKLARKENIKTVMVSNGYINSEPLKELLPYIDAVNIDLKCFDEKNYLRWTSAELTPVLDTLKTIASSKTHLEITTLMVPGVNDDKEQLEEMYLWIANNIGKDAIVHISRFFPYYKVLDKEATPIETLKKAAEIAKKHVDFVYVGNVFPSAETHNTYCPSCHALLIDRTGNKKTIKKCSCGAIPGVFL